MCDFTFKNTCPVSTFAQFISVIRKIAQNPHTIALYPGSPAPFLYTPTSLLPEHSVLTDVQQATWITCRSGGQGTRPKIWMGGELVVNSSTANSAKIWLGSKHPNGLYHCLSGQSQREYFSLFFTNAGTKYVRMCYTRNALVWTPGHIHLRIACQTH